MVEYAISLCIVCAVKLAVLPTRSVARLISNIYKSHAQYTLSQVFNKEHPHALA